MRLKHLLVDMRAEKEPDRNASSRAGKLFAARRMLATAARVCSVPPI